MNCHENCLHNCESKKIKMKYYNWEKMGFFDVMKCSSVNNAKLMKHSDKLGRSPGLDMFQARIHLKTIKYPNKALSGNICVYL